MRLFVKTESQTSNPVVFYPSTDCYLVRIEESDQHFVPGRTAELLDFLADVSGALFAIILANWVAHLTRADKQISSD